MHKLLFVTGVGVGYVLGARAGRERYEELRLSMQRAAEHPKVHEVAEKVSSVAADAVDHGKEKAQEVAPKLQEVVGKRKASSEDETSAEPEFSPTAGPQGPLP